MPALGLNHRLADIGRTGAAYMHLPALLAARKLLKQGGHHIRINANAGIRNRNTDEIRHAFHMHPHTSGCRIFNRIIDKV